MLTFYERNCSKDQFSLCVISPNCSGSAVLDLTLENKIK